MIEPTLNTQDKIFDVAYNVFLLFGYHGTTLNQIASNAGVNKAAIHYYFRSKDKLYAQVVKLIVDLALKSKVNLPKNRKREGNPLWFIFTEQYNNWILFENTIKELYPGDWENKQKELAQWLEFSKNPLSHTYRESKKK